jgi:hypothetical protein
VVASIGILFFQLKKNRPKLMIETSTNTTNSVSFITLFTWFMIQIILLENKVNAKRFFVSSNPRYVEKQKRSNRLFNHVYIAILAFIARFIRAIPIYASD